MEPAATNIVTVDSIRRFGGSSAVAMPWPEEDDSMEDRFDRLEKLIISAVKKMGKSKKSKKKEQEHGHEDNRSSIRVTSNI